MAKTIKILTLILLVLGAAQSAWASSKRPMVAVAEFSNQTRAHWWSHSVGWDLAGMLTNELASTGDFRVLERSRLQKVMAEQNLAASGRVDARSGAKIGKLAGAKYIVLGTVSAFEKGSKGSDAGISIKGFSIGGKKQHAYVAIDLRVVDTTTGVVEYVRTVEGTAKSGGLRFKGYYKGIGGSLGKEAKTPTGKAIRGAILEATDYLSCVMVWQDSCMKEYRKKERKRRQRTKDSLDLE